jgi:hypothetical protein
MRCIYGENLVDSKVLDDLGGLVIQASVGGSTDSREEGQSAFGQDFSMLHLPRVFSAFFRPWLAGNRALNMMKMVMFFFLFTFFYFRRPTRARKYKKCPIYLYTNVDGRSTKN